VEGLRVKLDGVFSHVLNYIEDLISHGESGDVESIKIALSTIKDVCETAKDLLSKQQLGELDTLSARASENWRVSRL